MEKVVTFHSQGQAISASFSLPHERAPCVIMSHGLEGSKDGSKWHLLATRLYDSGIASLRFNYRGCGQGAERSQGKFEDTTLSGRIQDFQAALDFVTRMAVDRSRLGVIGSSLGGTVALAAWDIRIKAMVTLATPYLFQKPTEEQLKLYQAKEFFNLPSGRRLRTEFLRELWHYDVRKDVDKIDCPLLIIHGSADQEVSVDDARHLYERAKEPKQLKIISGGNHGFDDPVHLQQVVSLACDWQKRYL